MTAESAKVADEASLDRAVPLTILTGFLGAGKTTLLNRLLTSDHGRRVAVLVNDFGSVNIDAELVVGVDDNMMSLANGCVCCEIRDDLLDSVEQLVTMVDPPEHIVLEASGVADPASIWATFAGSRNPDWLRLDGVICVVDTEQIFTNLDEAPDLLMLRARQIGFADLVILNKVDVAGPDLVDWVRNWIDTVMDKVRMIEAVQCDVPVSVLLGVDRPTGQPSSPDDPVVDLDLPTEADHDHGTRFRTFSYETEKIFDESALRKMIHLRFPGTVYRCKGFVRVADGMMLLQVVGRRMELTPALEVGGPSRIVAISTVDLDEAEVRASLDGCLVA
ncbi:MAG: CobW family GTP-binding protein [Microthrixaceae bacterium]